VTDETKRLSSDRIPLPARVNSNRFVYGRCTEHPDGKADGPCNACRESRLRGIERTTNAS
jgi:hypothetical protein